jgi:hypothetical protein
MARSGGDLDGPKSLGSSCHFVYILGMLDIEKVIQISRDVAKSNLPPQSVVRVESEPTFDSQGDDALRITIVVAAESADQITGDAAVDTLVQIHDRLRDAGDGRFPIIEYTTEAELAEIDDP